MKISSNKKVFLEAAPALPGRAGELWIQLQTDLDGGGGASEEKTKMPIKKSNLVNPPHSVNIKTNLGKEFLMLPPQQNPKP